MSTHFRFLVIILILPLVLLAANVARADVQDIVLEDITPRELLSHSTISLALSGDVVYTLGAGNRLLNVYDIRNIVAPRRMAIIELEFDATHIYSYNDAAYILSPGTGLVILEIGNPFAPKISHIVDLPLSSGARVAAGENLLFVHDGISALHVYAFTRPWELEKIAELQIFGGGGLEYMGDFLYLMAGDLKTIDVSDPADPNLHGEYWSHGGAFKAISSDDGYVYAVDEGGNLSVFETSPDGQLTLVGSKRFGASPIGLVVENEIAAVATADDLLTFDVGNPAKIEKQGDLPLLCELRDIVARDNYFFIASELDGPLVVDMTDPFRQRVVSFQAGLGLVSTVASKGNLMLTGSWDSIRALERDEAGNLKITGIQHSEGFTRDMQITGDFAYLADPGRGLRVFNVSRPIFMRPVALLELPGIPSDVELVIDELAFVALGDEGVAQVNVHYPFSPILRMMIETDHPVTNIARAGDFLYFIGPEGNFSIYDISLPTQPRLTAWMKLDGITPIDAVVSGDLLAISGGRAGLWLMDVSDPIHPILRSKYITAGSVETADLFDGGAIIEVKGIGFTRLEAVDLRKLFAPYRRDVLQINVSSEHVDKIHVVGDRAYLAAYNYGMKIIALHGLMD